MTTNITPDRARALLRGDFASDAHQTSVGNLEAGTIITGAYIFGTPGDFALTEAAYALAQTVANLHYEYAVQKLDGNEWKLTDLDGRALESYEYEKVTWCDRPIPQSDIADRGPGWRIVRRLVTAPEVAE